MRAPWITGLFVLTLACGSDPAPSPTPTTPVTPPPTRVAPSITAPPSTAPSTAPPSTAPPSTAPPAALADDPALDALLPDPPPPLTLAHARALSREGSWLEAAAVYGALLRETPTEPRYLAGRGFALASSAQPGAIALARADYVRALALASDDGVRALVHYNLGLLDEDAEHLADAHGHYAEANRLHPTRAAAEGLARTSEGGASSEDEDGASDPVVCQLAPVGTATAANDLRAVVALLVRTEEQDYVEDEPPTPATEEEAAALLCHTRPCDVTRPFVSDFVLGSGVFEAHVVVPRPAGGYWVVPRVGPIANGPAARCPDELRGEGTAPLTRPGMPALARARVTWLENDWNECFDEEPEDGEDGDGEECLDGCWWNARQDLELVLEPASGRFVVGSARRALREATEEGSSLLPDPAFVATDHGLELTACDRHDAVTLTP